jgi:transcriptional regulator of acetoin/glycerol metabolism
MIIKLGLPQGALKDHEKPRHVRQTRQSYKKPPAPAVRAAIETSGGRVATAAASLGVHRATLYRWLQDDPALAEAVRAIYRQLAESAASL